jgi:hypothetical protein
VTADDSDQLIERVICVLRDHLNQPADERAVVQLTCSGALRTRNRALAVQVLVNRNIRRSIAEKIVDELLGQDSAGSST